MIESNIKFPFGRNWNRFVDKVDEKQVYAAIDSLNCAFGEGQLVGKEFVDVGCGSGLFSLAAVILGAKVISLDVDSESVRATTRVRDRFLQMIPCESRSESSWTIFKGNILDTATLELIRGRDIYYCWGVSHHTGDMWQANNNLVSLLNPRSMLYLALYNDQGFLSELWKRIKRRYCSSTTKISAIFWQVQGAFILLIIDKIYQIIKSDNRLQKVSININRQKSMNIYTDFIDWIGGYPFEVASIKELKDWAHNKNLRVDVIVDVGNRLGCNEYLIKRVH